MRLPLVRPRSQRVARAEDPSPIHGVTRPTGVPPVGTDTIQPVGLLDSGSGCTDTRRARHVALQRDHIPSLSGKFPGSQASRRGIAAAEMDAHSAKAELAHDLLARPLVHARDQGVTPSIMAQPSAGPIERWIGRMPSASAKTGCEDRLQFEVILYAVHPVLAADA